MTDLKRLCELAGIPSNALSETVSDSPHITRQFNILEIDNRRFMFNPKTKQFILGDARGAGKGKTILSAHSEEFYEIFGTNKGFDDFFVRGWVGTGGNYPQGIIHFTPPIPAPTPANWEYFEGGWKCLEFFRKYGGVSDNTIVRGWGAAKSWEEPIGSVMAPGQN